MISHQNFLITEFLNYLLNYGKMIINIKVSFYLEKCNLILDLILTKISLIIQIPNELIYKKLNVFLHFR